jgi:hypothetical protein
MCREENISVTNGATRRRQKVGKKKEKIKAAAGLVELPVLTKVTSLTRGAPLAQWALANN